jgi:hypothetical protein
MVWQTGCTVENLPKFVPRGVTRRNLLKITKYTKLLTPPGCIYAADQSCDIPSDGAPGIHWVQHWICRSLTLSDMIVRMCWPVVLVSQSGPTLSALVVHLCWWIVEVPQFGPTSSNVVVQRCWGFVLVPWSDFRMWFALLRIARAAMWSFRHHSVAQ